MIIIRPATLKDVDGIIQVCIEGNRVTYQYLLPASDMEEKIVTYYNNTRIQDEIRNLDDSWNGWIVADEDGEIIGAGAGGYNEEGKAEVLALYLKPTRKRNGIGTKILAEITKVHQAQGAKEQWVSFIHKNELATLFYEAQDFTFIKETTDQEGHRYAHYKRKI
ncbi:GNAT family N-acetyltransferase [Carnobacterium divergens]|uniref:GNAT family N-acetyltransferase n=1 Tax=Carnobacterium divergens TaxID=2748 RepID=UPI00288E7B98|nr:GNAT family N-acetyltransferase [Carnobacterium divergens]MDT1941600.1 GNAT family N-acetyltransferase [Carnobacterium divergens]